MYNNFLFICTLCLVFVSVNCEPDSADCPDPKSIEPCHCDREGISCFNSLDEQKLSQVFKVPNGYNAYRSVWITQNSIYNLTRNIFNGLRIQSFFIEENEIETIEEGAFTGSYEIVKQISLHRNKIKSFPFNELGLMEELERLTLSHNKLTIIPANSFSLATKLSAIDLSDNEIETLEPGAFFGMRNLQLISLRNNKLTQLPALSFGSNVLFTLDVSNNVINSIDRSTFLNAVPETIELSDNQLTFLDPNIFETLVKSYNTRIGIGGNPLTCRGCTKYKWLLSTSDEFIVDFQCANGRTLSDLNLLNIGCIF